MRALQNEVERLDCAVFGFAAASHFRCKSSYNYSRQ